MKKKSAFGASFNSCIQLLTDVESCIQELKKYYFLFWMGKYTSTRNTKSNIVVNEDSDEGADSEREEEEDQEEKENENEELSPCITPKVSKKGAREKPVIKEPIESPISVLFKTKAMRDQVETYAWKNIGEVLAKKNKNESNSTKQSKDSETLFGEMIAQELKQFTGRKRAILRHRIQNVIFEEQMKTFDEPTPSKVARSIPSAAAAIIPHSPPAYQQPTNMYGSPIYQPSNSSWNGSVSGNSFSYTNLLADNGRNNEQTLDFQ